MDEELQRLQAPDARMMPSRRMARGLGWFSLGMGLAQVLAPRLVARASGLPGHESMVQACGWRGIATGLGLLNSRHPTPWLWGRVAGDAMDLGLLGARAVTGGDDQRDRARKALMAVAAVTALDLACALAVPRAEGQRQVTHDYSDRSGLPQPPEQMRGAAREDFEVPEDMRTPPGMRPYTLH